MRTEYRFFNNSSGFISNIFYFDEKWQQANNFILPDVLFWLADNRKRRGEIGLEGYFSVARLADELQKRGFVRGDVCNACSWLVRKMSRSRLRGSFTYVSFVNASNTFTASSPSRPCPTERRLTNSPILFGRKTNWVNLVVSSKRAPLRLFWST
jgi:hypothetical protein